MSEKKEDDFNKSGRSTNKGIKPQSSGKKGVDPRTQLIHRKAKSPYLAK